MGLSSGEKEYGWITQQQKRIDEMTLVALGEKKEGCQ